MTSQIKTFLLLALLSGLILFLGGALGGQGGLMVALAFALVMNAGSYWFSDKIVLSMYRAREVGPNDAPALHAMVAELAQNAGVPKPRICVIPQEAPNAFATGRNPSHAVVAVTEGILRLLSPEELKGVLGHEIGHIAHRDILIQSVAGVMATVVMFIANMLQWGALFGGMRSNDEEGPGMLGGLVLALVAPIAASLIQMAISRSREYMADDAGAQFSRNPRSLASALRKLDAYSRQLPMRGATEATAHMFIVHPVTASRMASLFSTHPPIAERVARLEAMARTGR